MRYLAWAKPATQKNLQTSAHGTQQFQRKTLNICICIGVVLAAGCSPWNYRSQSPEETPVGGSKVKLVGDLAGPYGMFPVKVEAVGLVVGLPGTGSDPPPSPQRAVRPD